MAIGIVNKAGSILDPVPEVLVPFILNPDDYVSTWSGSAPAFNILFRNSSGEYEWSQMGVNDEPSAPIDDLVRIYAASSISPGTQVKVRSPSQFNDIRARFVSRYPEAGVVGQSLQITARGKSGDILSPADIYMEISEPPNSRSHICLPKNVPAITNSIRSDTLSNWTLKLGLFAGEITNTFFTPFGIAVTSHPYIVKLYFDYNDIEDVPTLSTSGNCAYYLLAEKIDLSTVPIFTVPGPNDEVIVSAAYIPGEYIIMSPAPQMLEISISGWTEEVELPEKGPYQGGGNSGEGGGGGTFTPGISENIKDLLPDGSSELDSSSSGLFTRYLMYSNTLRSFGNWLYARAGFFGAAEKDILSLLYSSPSEAVISLMSYPFNVGALIGTTAGNLKFGSADTSVGSDGILNGTSAQIDWGSIYLEEFWGNFLDYAPHTKISLYLPWGVGFVDIDPHECLPGSINVITNLEIAKGTCIHSVFGNKGALIGTYSGTVGSQLPITAIDTSGKTTALVTAAAATALSLGAAGAIAGSEAAIGSTLMNAGSMSATRMFKALEENREILGVPKYQKIQKMANRVAVPSAIAAARIPVNFSRNGSFTANGSGLSMQFPFVIISRPEQNVPENYGMMYGYPSNIYRSLGSLSGYTEVASIHLDGIVCTENERAEIDELLKGGVIL